MVEKEIGSERKLQLEERKYLVHINAEPLEFAEFINEIRENVKNESGKTMSQRDLAQYLRDMGYNITQPQVHRHLKVLSLDDKYLTMIREGNMGFITGYKLAKLSEEQKQRVLELAESEVEDENQPVRVYQRHLKSVKRETLQSQEIWDMLIKDKTYEKPYSSDVAESEPDAKEIAEIGNVISDSELNSLASQLKMRADNNGRIGQKELEMFVLNSRPVQDLINTISDKLENKIERDNPEKPEKGEIMYKVV